jgi:radical SAM protein with 4Fe4S-binding SPASM domain
MMSVKVSNYISQSEITKECYVVWNRFSPSLLKMNKEAIGFIDDIKRKGGIEENKGNRSVVEQLLKYKIFFRGDSDSFKGEFIQSVKASVKAIDKNAASLFNGKKDYAKLTFTNDVCNLRCQYCVNRYKNTSSPAAASSQKRLGLVNKIVDQFFERKLKNNLAHAKISFNGGEILLDIGLIKEIVEHISRKYSDIKVEYSLNTNMTLMTEEIARFFKRYNFKVYVSIDGYKGAHDRTRLYQDGRGSFDDVLKGLEIFRRYNGKNSIVGFQGTVDNVDTFDPEEVYKMSGYGFDTARLAPNLLNTSEEDALKKTNLIGRFLDLNVENSFKVTETYFENLNKLIELDQYSFFFNCKGLSAYPDIELFFNFSTLRLSNLCGYISNATMPFEELAYDIYNTKLWKVTIGFIRERFNSLLRNCIDCGAVGICRGGCIYTGLDKENEVNRAACVYQRELLKIYLQKLYKDKMN